MKTRLLIIDLKSTLWDIVKVFDDVNYIIETWSSLLSDIVDNHVPWQKHRVMRKHPSKMAKFRYN